MSYPANIVVVQDGRYRVVYNRGAGYPGSEAVLFLFSSEPYTLADFDDWTNDRWHPYPDAVYLIDHDQRRLLFETIYFYDFADEHAYRTLLLRLVRELWDGWRVDWAYNGVRDLVSHLGFDRSVLEERLEDRPERPRKPYPGSRVYCLVTVDDGDAVRAYGVSPCSDELAGHGPALVNALPPDALLTGCDTMPMAGMHLDLPAQTAGYWTQATLHGHLHTVAQTWPGWHWEFWEDDYTRQRALARGAVTIPDPDLDAAMTDFVTVWGRREKWDMDLVHDLLRDVLARPAGERMAAFADLVRVLQP